MGIEILQLTVAAVLLIGFSMGAVYPTVIAIIASRYPDNPGKAVSICAAMGSVGWRVDPLGPGLYHGAAKHPGQYLVCGSSDGSDAAHCLRPVRMLMGSHKIQAVPSLE